MACANGEVAPFVGHNSYVTWLVFIFPTSINHTIPLSFLRWSAIQDAAFVDPIDHQEKVWSEHNVSEDFDMAMRLQEKGYIIRWSTYSQGEFKEGVSLSADDELNRWQKYSYGCSELLFNPFSKWLTKGPINISIHRFIWCSAPLHYKLSILAYMFSYCGFPFLSIFSSLSDHPLRFHRRHRCVDHDRCDQLCPSRIPVPCGQLLHAQFRDLAGHRRRLLWIRYDWVHSSRIPTGIQGIPLGPP